MDTAEVMARVAERFEAEVEATVDDMTAVILEADPMLAVDAALVDEVRASCRANVRRYATVARRSAEPPPPDAPLEALDVARTFVRRGIEAEVLYRAYRRGQQVLWRHWMATVQDAVGSGPELAPVLERSLELLFTYVDEVLGRVVAEMQREREQVLGGSLARRAETIRLLLDGAPLDVEAAGRRLGHDLARDQVGLVLWTEGRVPAAGLEAAAVTLSRAAGVRRPLTFSAGTGVLWAWVATDGALELRDARVDDGVRVAVGPARRGPAGFRSSHDAAVTVQRLMSGNPEAGALATYEELEVTALAGHDEPRAREFVSATLGALAQDTPTAARLRETLRVFLEEADNAPRAARRLHTHRNTVLQRVARATELLGHPPSDNRLAVALALELRRRLGHRAVV